MEKIPIEFDKSEVERLDVILDLALKQTGLEFVRQILEVEEAIKAGEFTKTQILNLQYALDVALTRCGKSVGQHCLLINVTIMQAVRAWREGIEQTEKAA